MYLSIESRRPLFSLSQSAIFLSRSQVQVPKTRKTHCKKCNSHTSHKVTQYKKSKESFAAQGNQSIYEEEEQTQQQQQLYRLKGRVNEASKQGDRQTGRPSF